MKIGILGGGLTGLTLAYLLKDKGYCVEVLEKEEYCGGLMRSIQAEGFTFDIGGSHVIFSKDKNILNFMLSLLNGNYVRRRRNAKILYKGRFVKYPFENGLADLPKEDNFECIYYFIKNLIRREKGELTPPTNLKEWCYYTFGKGIAEKYLIPYNEKIWKYPLEKISLEWVERIPNPSIEDIIKSALGIPTEGYTHQLYFYYPKYGGIQSLIKSIESKINDKVNIITNFNVKRIKKEDKKWIVSNGKIERSYDLIISTIPVQELINALTDVPEEVVEASNNLKYNSLITVMIGLDISKVNDISWLYIPDKNILTHRVSFLSNYSPYVAPEGKSSILAEITFREGDEISRMKLSEVIERTVEDLHQLKIINKDYICYTNAVKLKYAYVINDLNYTKNIQIVRKFLRQLGIYILGRFGQFKYLNMDECIKQAINFVREFNKFDR